MSDEASEVDGDIEDSSLLLSRRDALLGAGAVGAAAGLGSMAQGDMSPNFAGLPNEYAWQAKRWPRLGNIGVNGNTNGYMGGDIQLDYLGATWEEHGNPKPEATPDDAPQTSGCWQHTFLLTSQWLTIHADDQEWFHDEDGDEVVRVPDTASYYLTDGGLTSNFRVETVATDDPDRPDAASVSPRRDASLYGVLDPTEFESRLRDSSNGDFVDEIARSAGGVSGSDAGYDVPGARELMIDQIPGETDEEKRETFSEELALWEFQTLMGVYAENPASSYPKWAATLGERVGAVFDLWTLGESILEIFDDVGNDIVSHDRGFNSQFSTDGNPHFGYVLFDVHVAPGTSPAVSIETEAFAPEAAGTDAANPSWTIAFDETPAPSWVDGAVGDAQRHSARIVETSFDDGETDFDDPPPAGGEYGNEFIDQLDPGPTPAPAITVRGRTDGGKPIHTVEDIGAGSDVFFYGRESYASRRNIKGYSWRLERYVDEGSPQWTVVETTNDESFMHQIDSTGEYRVSLTVEEESAEATDRGNVEATTSKQFSVGASKAPTAALSMTTEDPSTTDLVFFDASESTAPGEIADYVWTVEQSPRSDITDQEFTVSGNSTFVVDPQRPGNWTLSVEVVGANGATDTAQASAIVTQGIEAEIEASATEIDPGDSVTFDAGESVNPYGEITGYEWSVAFDEEGENVAHTFEERGKHTVNLTVHGERNEDGTRPSDTTSVTVEVGSTLPIAEIQAPESAVVGEWVPLVSASEDPDGEVVDEEWSGPMSTKPLTDDEGDVLAKFPEAGEQTVTLRVTDDDGNSVTVHERITVTETGEESVSIVGPESMRAGSERTFEADLSPEGWAERIVWSGDVSGSGESVTASFDDHGDYAVEVLAIGSLPETERGGLLGGIGQLGDAYSKRPTDTDETTVHVNERPEVSIDVSPDPPRPGEDVSLTAVIDDEDPIQRVDWGDAAADADRVTEDGTVVTKSFAEGEYTVSVSVVDAHGARGEVQRTFSVEPPGEGLDPSLTVTPSNPTDDDTVTMTVQPGATAPVETINWLAAASDASPVDGDRTTVEKTFAAGSHEVGVEVIDDRGRSGRTSTRVSVDEGTPGPEGLEIDGDLSPVPGEAVEYTASVTAPTDGSVTYEWSGAVDAEGPSVETTFEDSGEYTVSVTATAGGETATRSVDVTANTDPSVSLDAPSEASLGETVELTAEASDPDGDELTYDWGGAAAGQTGRTASVTFTQAGDNPISVTVTDEFGAEATADGEVTAELSPPPEVDIDGPGTIGADETATYTAVVTNGDEVTYEWGDAVSGDDREVEFDAGPGEYTLSVTVTDARDRTATAETSVTVNDPPTVSLDAPGTATVGEPVELTAEASDPNGDELTYDWGGAAAGQTGRTASVTFTQAGDNPISVTVTDEFGAEATADGEVTAELNPPPEGLRISGPEDVAIGETVTYRASAEDPNGDELSYRWGADVSGEGERIRTSFDEPGDYTVEVTVDDGTSERSTSTEVNTKPSVSASVSSSDPETGDLVTVTLDVTDDDGIQDVEWSGDVGDRQDVTDDPKTLETRYDSPGEKTVSADVQDTDGATGEASTTFTVEQGNRPPETPTIVGPEHISIGESVVYRANADDPDGDELTYEWGVDVSGDGSRTQVSFDEPGDYTLEVTVDDGEYTRSSSVTVNTRPQVSGSVSPSTPEVDQRVQITLDVTDDDDIQNVQWRGDVGDRENVTDDPTILTTSYASPGSKRVVADVQDADGATTTERVSVDVNGPPENLAISGPRDVDVGERVTYTASADDPNGDDLTYRWSGAVSGTGRRVRNVFDDSGDYILQVTVDDGTDERSTSIEVNTRPEVTIRTNPADPAVGDRVTVQAVVSDEDDVQNVSWSGDLGDRQDIVDDPKQFTTTWASEGAKTIEARVQDADGATTRESTTVDVDGNEPPINLTIDGDRTLKPGETEVYEASARDPNGDSLAYTWSGDVSGSGERIRTSFDDAGEKLLEVTADDGKATTSTSTTVLVNRLPTVSIDGPSGPVNLGETVEFVANANDPDGDSLTYDWGDAAEGDNGSRTSVTFTEAGRQTVSVDVTDEHGGRSSVSTTVDVELDPPPEIRIDGPGTIDEGERVTYTAEVTNGADVTSFDWSGAVDGDGREVTFGESPGTYPLAVTATDSDDRSDTARKEVTVEETNADPTVSISPSRSTVNLGETVEFTADASDPDGDDLDYQWRNAASGTGRTTSVTFTEQGSQTVTVRVTDGNGGSATANETVDVELDPPPEVRIDGPSTLDEDETGAYEAVVTNGADVETFEWGSTVTGQGQTIAFGADPGDYTLTVTATDSDDRSDTARKEVTVEENNAEPSVSISPSLSTADLGETVEFTADASDPDGDDLDYEWSNAAGGTGRTTEVTFTELGFARVTVEVTDGNGGSATANETVDVEANPKPDVEIDGPGTIDEDETETYTAEVTNGVAVDTFEWSGAVDGSGRSVTFGESPGTYNLEVTATDYDGRETTADTYVTVEGTNSDPSVSISPSLSTVDLGETVEFTADASDPDGDDLDYEWRYAASGTGRTTEVTFTEQGSARVTVEVTDGNGGSATDNEVVDVEIGNRPPSVSLSASPMKPAQGDEVTFRADASDPDNDDLTYEWDGVSGSGDTVTQPIYGSVDQEVTVTVEDEAGATDSDSVTIDPQQDGGGGLPSVEDADADGDGLRGLLSKFDLPGFGR